MAVMLSTRNLRSAPSTDPSAVITPAVIAPAGKKVEIVDSSILRFFAFDLQTAVRSWTAGFRR